MSKVKWLTWCVMYGGCLMVTLKPCDEFTVYWELKGEQRTSFQLLSPVFLSSYLGPWSRMQGKPGTLYLQPQAQFTVMAEINRVKPACDLAKPVLSHGTFLSECPSQGPIKGFTTEIGFSSNCQSYCQVLLSNSGTSSPFQILWFSAA